MSTASLATLLSLPLNERNAQSIIDLVVEATQHTTLAGQGTGYVICAGGGYAKYGYATCRWIREQLKDDAPIELWVGSNEYQKQKWDLDLDYRVGDAPGGWPLKARAVRQSSFEKVILLDADCIPFIKAADVWAIPFLNTGALFFPDVSNHRKTDWVYAALKLRPDAVSEMEGGQVLVDRVRHARAVVLCDYFNQHQEFFYNHHLGDKDLWALSFSRLKIPFMLGSPCQNQGWGLRHFLPDGTHYSDHFIHVKSGQECPNMEYAGHLQTYDLLLK